MSKVEVPTVEQLINMITEIRDLAKNTTSCSLSYVDLHRVCNKILIVLNKEHTPSELATASIGFREIHSPYIANRVERKLVNQKVEVTRRNINIYLCELMKQRILQRQAA